MKGNEKDNINIYNEGCNRKEKNIRNKKIIIFSLILFIIICILTTHVVAKDTKQTNKEDIIVKKEEKKEDNKIKQLKFIKFDIKGAVNQPGVYEIEEDKVIIDAINMAGGITSNATTDNINLSKKLENEMVIIVYTKKELNQELKSISQEYQTKDSNITSCLDKKQSVVTNTKTEGNEINTSSNNKISINTASKEELMNLTGIGEAKADNIINYRIEHGNFKDINELKNVNGIGESIFSKIKDNIVL